MNAARMVGEVAALDRAVSVALDWAEGKDGVLIVVTADHETGGIMAVTSSGAGSVPAVTWSTTGHTARAVDLYVWGTGADRFSTARSSGWPEPRTGSETLKR
jgi:alkaline phosphatase